MAHEELLKDQKLNRKGKIAKGTVVDKNESEYMAFRPGDLTGRIEAAATRYGCSKSEVVRKALEMYLDMEPLQPLAIYLGAVNHFVGVADAANAASLISVEMYDKVCNSLADTRVAVEKKLEALFRQLYPGEMTPNEFSAWRNHEQRRRKLTEEEMIGPDRVERWISALHAFGQFSDLREARRVLMRSVKENGPASKDTTKSPFPLDNSKKKRRK